MPTAIPPDTSGSVLSASAATLDAKSIVGDTTTNSSASFKTIPYLKNLLAPGVNGVKFAPPPVTTPVEKLIAPPGYSDAQPLFEIPNSLPSAAVIVPAAMFTASSLGPFGVTFKIFLNKVSSCVSFKLALVIIAAPNASE